jgi:hypothetical protein
MQNMSDDDDKEITRQMWAKVHEMREHGFGPYGTEMMRRIQAGEPVPATIRWFLGALRTANLDFLRPDLRRTNLLRLDIRCLPCCMHGRFCTNPRGKRNHE